MIVQSQEIRVLRSWKLLEAKVGEYFAKKGFDVKNNVKIRGRMVDLVAVQDNGKITAVEIKGNRGNIESGIRQALHLKNAVNFSYLALPKKSITKNMINACKNLGIGVISIDEKIREVVKPEQSKALLSVKRKVLFPAKKQTPQIKVQTSLDRLFRSNTLILILKLLFLNSMNEFHLNEIARRISMSPSTVYKEMDNIFPLGLVKKRKQGNLVLYKINKNSTIYNELRKIFLKYELAGELIKKELSKEKIKFALIFGSIAKGEETDASDVDLLVIGSIVEGDLMESVAELERRIGREIHYTLWTEKEFKMKSKDRIPLLREITNNPMIMVVGDEQEFKRITK